MSKGNACSRPSAWWPVALSLLLVVLSAPTAGAAGPFPFEDRNNNGLWDPGVDRDLTEDLRPNEWYVFYTTPNSIVIPAGVTLLTSVERFTGFYLVAGKNITVNSSINSAVYAGMVDLQAGGDVVIGPGVVLTGRDYVSVSAGGDITVGTRASFNSRGGSANLGTVNVRAATGDITFANGVSFGTLRDVFITALVGDITAGPVLSVAAPQGLLFIDGRQVTINEAQLRAGDMQIMGDGAPLQFRKNRVSVPKSGYFHIENPRASVDITGTVLPRIEAVSINAAHIIID